MALTEGQAQIGSLVLGPGTPYELLSEVNPWNRAVRAGQGGERAWGDGSWSGAEWAEQIVVPLQIYVEAATGGEWLALHQQLLAAFAPSHTDVDLRFVWGGTEYLMRGRPRMVEPDVTAIASGWSVTKAAFVALDPAIYSGVEHTATLRLPVTGGGLTVPMTLPAAVTATVTAGRVNITNAGTKPTSLRLRAYGPVPEPRISLVTPAGTAMIRYWSTLWSYQWLEIDTASRTVYLNGEASRRGQVTVEGLGWPVLPPGTCELAYDSPVYNSGTRLDVAWRDAWH
ncbi:hypothetical protein E1091_00345 [Micromonospora fluostatini]|uniref:Phage tail protein n=1 Tax=Micromonospora fluostatini TaxID=1629071 RepID=A0ABY2DM59_9ACTN|nr:hypothetical protein E1091_00345 [Micromonospora fluostatini]